MYFSLYYVKINVTWFRIYLKRRSINLFPFKAIYITNNYTSYTKQTSATTSPSVYPYPLCILFFFFIFFQSNSVIIFPSFPVTIIAMHAPSRMRVHAYLCISHTMRITRTRHAIRGCGDSVASFRVFETKTKRKQEQSRD